MIVAGCVILPQVGTNSAAMEWGMSKKREASEPTPILDFEDFKPIGPEQILVPMHLDDSGRPRLFSISRRAMRKGIALGMRYVGGNVISMAEAVLWRIERDRKAAT